MKHAVYSSKDGSSLLLVNDNLWVINGEWQIIKKDNVFYCVSPKSTFIIDIHLAGYIEYDGCYNSTLDRFRNGEGEHFSIKETPVIESVQVPELCKKKYYGIECFCSKCKR
jgi:hypothetical protein